MNKAITMRGPHRYEWSQFEINFMRANFCKLTNGAMAMMLGHRLTLVRTQCYNMGLKRMELEYWTNEQVKFLVDNFRYYGDTELAEIFDTKWKKEKGWSKKHIEKKRRYLSLSRSAEDKKAIKGRNTAMGRFAMCPVNAWKKRGIAPVGEVRIWANENEGYYKVIKLKNGWVHYGRWLYEQIFGPVPEGYVVRSKDNNPLNVTPGNLVMVTRKQHAALNSRSRTPKELMEIKTLSNQLNKLINERSNRKKTAKHVEPAV